MVFLHGGGHVQGSTSQVTAGVTLYDGATLAGKGKAVVVTLEYRLGQLGWLAADALREGGRPPGNYGLLDEIAALEWVKANIARFGGDPDRVLLFGESAGAVDTCLLVSSPRARGLFSRALIESGGCVAADPTDARRSATDFVQSTGCASSSTVAACLRALPVTTVLGAAPGAVALTSLGRPKYGPYVDGRILPSAPLDRIRAGEANQVPVVVGSNEDETALFVGDVPTAAAYGSALTHAVGRHVAQQILAEYPVTEFPSPRAALVAATTDAMFTCPTGDAERAFVAGQRKPVYRYFYTHAPETGPLRFVGAFHGAELFSVFGHLDTNEATPTASEQQLSDTVIGYWSRFAATGDPNGGGAPQWPASTRGSDRYLQVDTALKAGAGVRTAQCRFWAHLRG
jgi:para-nitrobenzyl esterase